MFYIIVQSEIRHHCAIAIARRVLNFGLNQSGPQKRPISSGARHPKPCGVKTTPPSVIKAVEKAHMVRQALESIPTVSGFWEWYDTEILGKNEPINDVRTGLELLEKERNITYLKPTDNNARDGWCWVSGLCASGDGGVLTCAR
jgi:hypothetical protein